MDRITTWGTLHMGDRRVEIEAGDHGIVFCRVVEPQLDRVYRLATVILGDRAEAEDAVHDAALRAWQHFEDLRDPGRFDAWFTRIVVTPVGIGSEPDGFGR
jgi:hypothetical protein